MRYIIPILFLLSGCTAEFHAVGTAAAKQAAQRADNALEASEWAWCKAAPHGAVMRRYWALKRKREARMEICWPEFLE